MGVRGGSNIYDHSGTYGPLGASSTAYIPGARRVAASCVDPSGNFWLFGGSGFDSVGAVGYLNDVWKFQPITGQWTWVSGNNTVAHNGNYGPIGVGSVAYYPGTRDSANLWCDQAGNVWLFGGYGNDSVGGVGYINDLWKFNTSNSQWTWVSGSNVIGQNGSFGTIGVTLSTNTPSSRYTAGSWIDSSNTFWLFGGEGNDSVGTTGLVSDLWKFQPGTGKWTWVAGSNLANQSGVYGTLSLVSQTNLPGARHSAIIWTDSSQHLWLFGGLGFDTNNSYGYMNDLWSITP